MPRGIFYVGRIYGAMRFKLRAAVLVASRIIQRDAALPKLRSIIRRQFGDFIETRGGFDHPAALEIRDGFIEGCLQIVGRPLRERRESNQIYGGENDTKNHVATGLVRMPVRSAPCAIVSI